MTLYQRIKKFSRGTLKHYETDLTVHDRRLCASMTPGTSALWSCRTMGTHFMWLAHKDDEISHKCLEDIRNRLNYFDAVGKVFGNEDGADTWYLLECCGTKQNGTTCKLTAEEAREIVLRRIKGMESALSRMAA